MQIFKPVCNFSPRRDKHSSSHHGSSGKDKHRDKDRQSSSHKSSSKDKHRDKEKPATSHDKEKEKEKDKEKHSSSSGNKEHKSSRHDKDKHKSSGRDKERDRDKDRHKSSSSKHHSSSGSSAKHRDKDKHNFSKPVDKHKASSHSNGNGAVDPLAIKEEPLNASAVSYGEHSQVYFNGATDAKLQQKCYVDVSQSSCDYSLSQFRSDEPSFHIKAEASDDDDNSRFGSNYKNLNETDVKHSTAIIEQSDDEEDIPIAARKKMKREVSEDEEDVPLAARKKVKTEKKAKKKKREQSDCDDEEEDHDEKPKKKKVKKEKVSKWHRFFGE